MSIIEKALDNLDSKKSLNDHIKPERNSHMKVNEESSNKKINDVRDKNNKNSKSRIINVNLKKLTDVGYLTPQASNKELFEQYRRIKMPLLQKAFPENASARNIIMVTSSLESEGKSFTAVNLAMSIAYELNFTVLLIDADVTKKMTSHLFGVDKEKGLIDYLGDNSCELSSLILRTNIPKLNILPAGAQSANVTELYNSNKMAGLSKELSNRYSDRVVLIDTPPIMQDSSTFAIKNISQQILFVVEAEKTPQHIIEKALNTIGGDVELGLVLNKSNQRSNPSYYY